MSDILPVFASAPKMVIYVNNQRIGYALGLSVNVSIAVDSVQVLGEFISQSIEPLYMPPVSGTFTVIELLSPQTQANMKSAANTRGTISNPAGTYSDLQKKGQTFAPALDNTTGSGADTLNNQFLYRHLDPATVLISQTFDLAVYIKVPRIGMDSSGVCNYTDIKNRESLEEFLFIKDCRLQSKNVSISPGSLVNVPLEFSGLLVQNAALAENAREQLDSSNYQT
jgi:hypothetical protein